MQPPATPRRRIRQRPAWFVLLLMLLVTSVLAPRLAAAASPEERPVIVPGREAEVLALFEPHEIGSELSPGWMLHSFRIDGGTIVVFVVEPETEAAATVTLDHPKYGPPKAKQITGFALLVAEQPAGSEAAVSALVATIEANDDGSFWGQEVVYAQEPRAYELSAEGIRNSAQDLRQWVADGLVVFTFLSVLLLVLTLSKLRGAPRWIPAALVALSVGAGLLRWQLSPEVALAPWPYTRELMSGARIFHGPVLALLHPDPVWMSETILDSTLAYALLAPFAVYVHARYLLDDPRAALLTALVVAVLPLHLRFSHSDAAFIPSITVSSTCFALIHAITREQRGAWGWLALLIVGPLLALMYAVRPLNIMYYPLLVATAFVNQGSYTDKPPIARARAIAAFLVVSAVTFGLGVPRLLEGFGQQVNEGLSLDTLRGAMTVMFSPRFNALLNPMFTPPGLLALALYGTWDLWQRGRRALLYFLVAWLLGFLVAHAYVVPYSPYMQARYHLHLVVPFMLLCACGAEAGLRWLADPERSCPRALEWTRGRETLVTRVAVLYVLASPLIHLHGVRYEDFNDMREWHFVHAQREQIPAGCTVLEYTGYGADMRFRRVGRFVERGVDQEAWSVTEFQTGRPGEPELPEISDEVRALLQEPPECLYWYEGLPCFGHKPEHLPKAPGCDAIEGWVELEEVASERLESAPYDENLAGGIGDFESFELRLFRVLGPK